MGLEFGRLTAVFDADTKRFDSALRTSVNHVHGLDTSLTGLRGQLGSVTTALTGFVSPTTLATGAISAYTSAVIAAHVALFALTKDAADFGSKIHDMAQEAGASAETISTLAYAAKLSGRNIEEIIPGLRRFEVTIGDAAKGSKEAEAALKRLGIDPKKAINDLDGAMAQAFKRIHDAGSGITQVNLAADAFGKRSGPNMISTIETMNGDFAKFQQQARGVGAVLSTDAANAADEFGDKLDEVTQRVHFLGVQFGLRLVPQVLEGLDIINRAISDTPRLVAAATSATQIALESQVIAPLRVIEALLRAIEQPRSIPINIVAAGPAGLIAYFLGQSGKPSGALNNFAPDISGGAGVFRKKMPPYGGAGGAGRGGGGRDALADTKRSLEIGLQSTLATLQAEQDAVQRSYDHRRLRIESFYRALSRLEEIRHQTVVDTLKQETDLAEKIKNPTERKLALEELGQRKIEEANRHRQESWRLEDQINNLGRERIALADTLLQRLTREREVTKQIAQERLRFASAVVRTDLGGGSFELTPELKDQIGRPRIATAEEQGLRDRLAEIRERMRELSGELTSVFSQSISDGFNNGIKSGLQTLAQGLLRIVEEVFLRRMAEGLANMLSGLASGGGGGLAGKIITIGATALIGGFGGGGISSGGLGSGIAGAIGRDSGGPLWPNQLYKVHKDEFIVPTAPGYVIPKGGMGQKQEIHYHNTIMLPPDSRGNYSSPKSRRQLSETLIAALQASQT